MPFDGRQVVVTGGAGGIGALVVGRLKAAGAKILVVDRVPPADRDIPHTVGDLSSSNGIAAISAIIALEAPDILVNLAGVQYFGPTEGQGADQVVSGYMVNLVAPVLLARAALPGMKQRSSGQIVNIGSIFGSINYPHFATYSSAKAGLRGFSEALRRELRGTGIDVTYIAPRAVRTGLNSGTVMRFVEMAGMKADEPDDVAATIVRAIALRKKDVFIGAKEGLFVRINGLAPRLVDAAITAETIKARSLFGS